MEFLKYTPVFFESCLSLFDMNCPKFFAPNERADYEAFLRGRPKGYRVGLWDENVVAAFGFRVQKKSGRGLISWIMVSPKVKGCGVGRQMMAAVGQAAFQQGVGVVDIAASHLSAPFFAGFGARAVKTIPDGWGPDMHRVNMEWAV